MSVQEITAKVTKGDRANVEYTVKHDVPDTIDEARARFGDEVVYSRFVASYVIDLQAFMRGQIAKDNFDPSKLQVAIDGDGTDENPGWKPGTRKRGKSVVEKLQEMLGKLSEEERATLLAELA